MKIGAFLFIPMAKTVIIPEYLLVNMLRHYKALASADIDHADLRAINAKRIAPKEIAKIEKYLTNNNDTPCRHITH